MSIHDLRLVSAFGIAVTISGPAITSAMRPLGRVPMERAGIVSMRVITFAIAVKNTGRLKVTVFSMHCVMRYTQLFSGADTIRGMESKSSKMLTR